MQEFRFQEATPAATARASAQSLAEPGAQDTFSMYVKPLTVRVRQKKTTQQSASESKRLFSSARK